MARHAPLISVHVRVCILGQVDGLRAPGDASLWAEADDRGPHTNSTHRASPPDVLRPTPKQKHPADLTGMSATASPRILLLRPIPLCLWKRNKLRVQSIC